MRGQWSPFSSVQSSRSIMAGSLWPHGLQHAGVPCPSPSLEFTKLMYIKSVMPSNHLILCHPLLLLPSIVPRIRIFSNESVLPPGSQSIVASASASVIPMNIQDWFPLGWTGWIQGALKSLLQHHSSKASILRCSAFFTESCVQLSHPNMTTGKTIALTRQPLLAK